MKRREGHSPTPQEEIGAEPLRVPFFPFICQDKEWCCSSFEQTRWPGRVRYLPSALHDLPALAQHGYSGQSNAGGFNTHELVLHSRESDGSAPGRN